MLIDALTIKWIMSEQTNLSKLSLIDTYFSYNCFYGL